MNGSCTSFQKLSLVQSFEQLLSKRNSTWASQTRNTGSEYGWLGQQEGHSAPGSQAHCSSQCLMMLPSNELQHDFKHITNWHQGTFYYQSLWKKMIFISLKGRETEIFNQQTTDRAWIRQSQEPDSRHACHRGVSTMTASQSKPTGVPSGGLTQVAPQDPPLILVLKWNYVFKIKNGLPKLNTFLSLIRKIPAHWLLGNVSLPSWLESGSSITQGVSVEY